VIPDDLADWERARYKRFLELQRYCEFDDAIRILGQEFPKPPRLEHRPPQTSTRPRRDFCHRGHDLSLTRRFDHLGISQGCAQCRRDREREQSAREREATG
jgi:hypothetical protein